MCSVGSLSGTVIGRTAVLSRSLVFPEKSVPSAIVQPLGYGGR
jgi:hypothetical protein